MSSEQLEILAARKQLLATQCSLQRLKAAHDIEQIRTALPFGPRRDRFALVTRYVGLAFTLWRFIRSALRR